MDMEEHRVSIFTFHQGPSVTLLVLTLVLISGLAGTVSAGDEAIPPGLDLLPESVLHISGTESLTPMSPTRGASAHPSAFASSRDQVGLFSTRISHNGTIVAPSFDIYAHSIGGFSLPSSTARLEADILLDGMVVMSLSSPEDPLGVEPKRYSAASSDSFTVSRGQTLGLRVFIIYVDRGPEVLWGTPDAPSRFSFGGDAIVLVGQDVSGIGGMLRVNATLEEMVRGLVDTVELVVTDRDHPYVTIPCTNRSGNDLEQTSHLWDIDVSSGDYSWMGDGEGVYLQVRVTSRNGEIWVFDLGDVVVEEEPEPVNGPLFVALIVIFGALPTIFLSPRVVALFAPLMLLLRRFAGKAKSVDGKVTINDRIVSNKQFRDFKLLMFSIFYANLSLTFGTFIGWELYNMTGKSAMVVGVHGSLNTFLTFAMAPLVWGAASDKKGNRKNVLIASNVVAIAVLLLMSVTAGSFASLFLWALVLTFFVFAKFLYNVMTTEYFPDEVRGTALSYIIMADILGAAVGTAFGGFIYEAYGLGFCFILAAVFRVVSTGYLFPVRDAGKLDQRKETLDHFLSSLKEWLVEVTRVEALRESWGRFRVWADPRRWFAGYNQLPHRRQFDYMIAHGLIGAIGGSIVGMLWGYYLMDNGLPESLFSVCLLFGNLLGPLMVILAGRSCDRFGPRKVFVATQLLGYGVFWLGFNLFVLFGSKSVESMFAVGLFFMIPVWPFAVISSQHFISELTGENLRGRALAILGVGGALGNVVGNLAGGYMKDTLGYDTTFWLAIIPIYAAAFIAYYGVWVKRPKGMR